MDEAAQRALSELARLTGTSGHDAATVLDAAVAAVRRARGESGWIFVCDGARMHSAMEAAELRHRKGEETNQ